MTAAGSSLSKMEGSVESLSSPLAAVPLSSAQGSSIVSYHMVHAPQGQEKLISCDVNVQSESMPHDANRQMLAVSGGESGQTQALRHNIGQMKLSMPNKRKASTEISPNAEGGNKMPFPNRRFAQGSFVNASSATSPSISKSPRSTGSGKKVVPLESSVHKSQVGSNESLKSQAASDESVRSKMRESLASALAMASKQQERSSVGKIGMQTESEVKKIGNEHNDIGNGFSSKETCEEVTQTRSSMESNLQANPVLSDEDAAFWDGLVFKDELVQSNGLSWASEFDTHISEVKQIDNTDEPILTFEQTLQSPEFMALKIELELYKLFGGVNKKYKEKGRSLLFNLKDRNNPDLREKVMSGEIPPDRLCPMTAEELASKELSQWRIAKAEELDYMRVLPDSEVNMRRLVKKTHKGEYQVDLDPDIGVPEEIPLGTSVSIPNSTKNNGVAASPRPRVEKNKENRDSRIGTPSDGADLKGQGVVDDVRDLPPIVSFDQFMESHDKEPLIEKQLIDSQRTTESVKETSELGSESKSPVKHSELSMEMTSEKKKEVSPESSKPVSGVNSTDSKVDTFIPVHPPQGERVWEGEIQLNISSMANFIALYKSGQKASTKEWPSYFEIKGRVKLDAFEKFVEALPMSRSRAIMVSHFVLMEPSSDFERGNLIEVVDSYNADQRLGFAEPIPGVELYLCPPRSTTVDIIINRLPKSYTLKLNDIDNGLIGIVVWRKVQIVQSPNSPNSRGVQNAVNYDNKNVGLATRHAPLSPIVSKPQPGDDDDDNDDVPPGFGPSAPRDDDDLPEFSFLGGSNTLISPRSGLDSSSGHGPTSHRLPSRAPSGQVEQMRELIKKYGQNEKKPDSGIPLEPWNDDDDDDDDIPEWRPQSQQPLPQPGTSHYDPLPPPQPMVPTQRPILPPVPPPPQQPFLHVQNPHVALPIMPDHNSRMPSQMPVQHPWHSFGQPLQPLQPPMRVHQHGNMRPYGGPNNVGSGQMQGTPSLGINPSDPSRDWNQNASNYRGY